MANSTFYQFLPYLRLGMSSFLTGKNLNDESITEQRAQLTLGLNLEKTDIAGGVSSEDVTKVVSLYGPGEVCRFEESVIKSHDPKNDVGDFEPNYFPAINFHDADYPWRYTPFSATADEKLTPWLTLIVLIAEDSKGNIKEFEEVVKKERTNQTDKNKVAFIKNVSTKNLPDLNESWRWGHVQITGNETLNTIIERDELLQTLENNPHQVSSRLLCARRLKPGVLYNAFLVPTFKLGIVSSGLIEPDDTINITTLSWDVDANSSVNLPYYYRWEFRTGERGDFEKLVRDLEPRTLTEIGLREMACSRPGYGIEASNNNDPLELKLEGALKTLDTVYSQWGRDSGLNPWQAEDMQNDIKYLLNINADNIDFPVTPFVAIDSDYNLTEAELIQKEEYIEVSFKTDINCDSAVQYSEGNTTTIFETGEFNLDKTNHKFIINNLKEGKRYRLKILANSNNSWLPISELISINYYSLSLVLPPLYGQWHAKKSRLETEINDTDWFNELNLDPRHRAAAGTGAEVVRKNQESLMESAWDQAGDIDFANMIVKQHQLGIEVSNNVVQRMSLFSDEDFIADNRSLHKRTKLDLDSKNITIAGHIKQSRIPKSALDPAFKKLTRVLGPIKKRLKKGGVQEGQHILSRFNDPVNPFRAAGELPVPKGTVNICDILDNIKTEMTDSLDSVLEDMNGDDDICCCCYCTERRSNNEEINDLEVSDTNHTCCCCAKCLEKRKDKDQKNSHKIVREPIRAQVNTGDESKEEKNKYSVQMAAARRNIAQIQEVYGDLSGFSVDSYCENGLGEIFTKLREKILGDEEFTHEGDIPVVTEDTSAKDKQKALIYGLPSLLASDTRKPLGPSLNMKKVREGFAKQLDPKVTINARLMHRINVSPKVQFSIDRLMPAPEFPQPMYIPLSNISQDYICPGIQTVKENTVALLSTNGRFIESYMCGLNHEMAAELLWREYPTDQRGTYFKQFWEPVVSLEIENIAKANVEDPTDLEQVKDKVREILEDIKPIDEWRKNKLGDNPSNSSELRKEGILDDAVGCDNDENIVLIIRGNLLKKYPDTDIYIYKEEELPVEKDADTFMKGLINTLDPDHVQEFAGTPPAVFNPFFRADIPKDISLIGFDLRVCDILREKHYLVLEERVSRVRFGLDINYESGSSIVGPPDWNNLSWDHFAMNDIEMFGKYLDSRELAKTDGLPSNNNWDDNAAQIAGITQQKPVRIVISLNDMIPAELLEP